MVDAYGSGNKPVLAGSASVANWTNIGNNIWQASCSACGDRVTGLYRDNTALPLGRFPNLNAANKGYLTVQSHSGKTQLTGQQTLSTNWTGGEVVFRPVQWILNRSAITAQSGNTLTLASAGTYDISDGWGYFIQSHPATLDQVGEWYYNPSNKTIQLFDNQNNPNNQSISATANAEAVNLSNVAYVTIRNVQITQGLVTNLSISNSTNLVINGNTINQGGEDGVLLRGSGHHVTIENNQIEDINNNGVDIGSYQDITFRGNGLRRIALIPGRGRSGDGTYVGFISASTANTLIEDNVLDNIGYNALNFSTSTTIQRNQISNFCLTKSDGSGLYIWNGNQQPMGNIRIMSNVVYNGIGVPEGTPGGAYSGANGIYFDDCTLNMEVANNTVYNCRGLGFFLHGSSNIRLTGNTSFNNGEGQLAITTAGGCQPRNNVILNNVFVSRLANQFNVKYESAQNDLASFGQFDNNVYARPFDDTYTIRAVYNNTVGADLSLEQWRSRYGKDLLTTKSPITYSWGNPDDLIRFVANASGNAIQVPLDGPYRDARNNVVSGQVTVAAYSSVVLFRDAAIAPVTLRNPENPANAVNGLDYSYYEGSWGNLPNFGSLTPIKTGTNGVPNLSVRNREENYGLRYVGYVSVPTDGVYTFYTNSDDGSKLLIGTTEVVNNDGGHGEQERSGTIGLKAGVHALSVTYFQGGGGQALTVSYSGPGIGKQVIPASAYRRVGTVVSGSGTGLRAEYFNNKDLAVPIFMTRTDATIDFDWGGGSPTSGMPADYFSVRWTGKVKAPLSGNYTFSTTTDDGVRLWVNGRLVVDDWNGRPTATRTSPTIEFVAGQLYDIRMEYFENIVGAVARLSWAYPGQGQQIVPQIYLYPTTGTSRIATGSDSDPEMTVQVYPIPARDEVKVRYYAEIAGDVALQLTSTAGYTVMEKSYPVVQGVNIIRIPVLEFNRGIYLLRLVNGPQTITRKVLLTD